ncbi:MAG: thioredoxin family protein [Nitrospirae bacterium]|nr:thioredoxin family protein [Nitrospirota bacterium]
MDEKTISVRCSKCMALNKLSPEMLKAKRTKCGKCGRDFDFIKAPVHVTAQSFKQEVLSWPDVVLVEFWAEWCGACRILEPALNELALKKAGRLKIAKIDVDQEKALVKQFGIKATPTLILYNKGHRLNEAKGALSIEQLEDLDNSLA